MIILMVDTPCLASRYKKTWQFVNQMHGMVYGRHVWHLNTDTPCMALNSERRQAWRLYVENINDYKYVGKQIQ